MSSTAETNNAAAHFDVIVVGGGNAACCAALSAHDHGARVLIVESASHDERGGNSRFAGTIFRASHRGLSHIKQLLCEEAMADTDLVTVDPYTDKMYYNDLMDVSHDRSNRSTCQSLIAGAWPTMEWMKGKGVKWELSLRKYYNADGHNGLVNITPGAAVMVRGGGVGLVESLWSAVERTQQGTNPITIKYDSPGHDLLLSGDTVLGVKTRQSGAYVNYYGNVILAAGGFSANPAMRRQFLGEGWDLVLVRGTRHNTGTMLRRCIDAGARAVGHWGAAHASPQDYHGPLMGDITRSPMMPRYAYQYGITVNVHGNRFFDEGEAEWTKTYAKTGKKIADQPEAKAFQIFDQQTIGLLPKRYETATPIQANGLEGLARAMKVDVAGLKQTIEDFNQACSDSTKFEPDQLDGLCTNGSLPIPKSNWAVKLNKPPFVAYAVTCGITFTYGGIQADNTGRVINNEGRPMPRLWAVGEMSGDLFYHNYPGGAGLTKGAVFGRIAGREAALSKPRVGAAKL